ncbi:DNA helicase PIF1, ATP-dependent, partial [Tanacetum coccineum]
MQCMLLFTFRAWKSIGMYMLELGVADDTAHVVVVLFDEPATELVKCSIESLLALVNEVSLYPLFQYFHSLYTNLYLQSANEDSNLPAAITNLIGTTHVLELKSYTYYEYGTFESFTCWKINPTPIVEEGASSSTVDENADTPLPAFKRLLRHHLYVLHRKAMRRRKRKDILWAVVEQ